MNVIKTELEGVYIIEPEYLAIKEDGSPKAGPGRDNGRGRIFL
jgi:hypothetical protein